MHARKAEESAAQAESAVAKTTSATPEVAIETVTAEAAPATEPKIKGKKAKATMATKEAGPRKPKMRIDGTQ